MSSPSDPLRSRRRLLSGITGVGLSLLAGCLGSESPATGTQPSVSRSSPPASTTEGTTTTEPSETNQTTTHYRSVEISLSEVSAETVAEAVLQRTEDMRPFEQTLVDQTLDKGTTTFTHTIFEPLYDRFYLSQEGEYFELSRSIVSEQTVSGHRFDLESITTCQSNTPEITEDTIPYERLPKADKEIFSLGNRTLFDEKVCFDGGMKVYYPPEAEESSIFINESPTFVRYDDATYLVRYEEPMQLTQTTFRFTATQRGSTKAEYVAAVVPDVVWHVESNNLSEPEREFFTKLLEDGYFSTENPVPDAVDAFLARIFENAYPRTRQGYYLEFENSYYQIDYEEVR